MCSRVVGSSELILVLVIFFQHLFMVFPCRVTRASHHQTDQSQLFHVGFRSPFGLVGFRNRLKWIMGIPACFTKIPQAPTECPPSKVCQYKNRSSSGPEKYGKDQYCIRNQVHIFAYRLICIEMPLFSCSQRGSSPYFLTCQYIFHFQSSGHSMKFPCLLFL